MSPNHITRCFGSWLAMLMLYYVYFHSDPKMQSKIKMCVAAKVTVF